MWSSRFGGKETSMVVPHRAHFSGPRGEKEIHDNKFKKMRKKDIIKKICFFTRLTLCMLEAVLVSFTKQK